MGLFEKLGFVEETNNINNNIMEEEIKEVKITEEQK